MPIDKFQGVGPSAPAQTTGKTEYVLYGAARDLQNAMKGVLYSSESDYPYTGISSANPERKQISGELVMHRFKHEVSKFFADDGNGVALNNLATELFSPPDLKDFFDEGLKSQDPKEAKAFKDLKRICDTQLSGVKMLKVGPKGQGGKLDRKSVV
jgi:hypothetical protein